MSSNTKIEWTQETWNPMLGCSKISPGCKHCYAINHVHRMAGNPNATIAAANEGLTVIQGGHPNWTGKVRLIPERLNIPLKKRKPTTYFVNSLSDLFHEDLADEDVARVWETMAKAHWHTFQVLTKRSGRADELLNRFGKNFSSSVDTGMAMMQVAQAEFCGAEPEIVRAARQINTWPHANIWLGVSVESRDYLDRIDHLRKTPAAVRFLSLEPLLEDLGELDLTGIHWVIVGGESGPGARPMDPEWARRIRSQCIASRVPFFFKQWGEYLLVPKHDGAERMVFRKVGKKKAGRLLDGREWNEMPEVKQGA